MPKISVIIPLYNKEKYVETALLSVLNQSFSNIEVIVVNDGSSDNSLSIVSEIAKKDVRVRLFDIPNGGVSNARNIGLDNARGEWIQFLDADDCLEHDYFKRVMEILQWKTIDILFSGFSYVDCNKKLLKDIKTPCIGYKNQIQLCELFILSQYETGFFGFISNKIFNRDLLTRSNARFPIGVTLAEDLDFYVKLYPAVKCAYFWEGKSFSYLQTETNYLHNVNVDFYSQLDIQLDIKHWFEQVGLYEVYKDTLNRKICQYVGFVLFDANEKGENISKTILRITQHNEIMKCIDPYLENGFNRLILAGISKKKNLYIRVLFALRNRIRRVYRMVKKNE